MTRLRVLGICLTSLVFLVVPAAQASPASFTEPGPPITQLEASAPVFYPLVRDKYLDETTIKWLYGCDGDVPGGVSEYDLPGTSCAAYSITDSAGTVVLQARSPASACFPADTSTGEMCISSPRHFDWDGRNSAGDLVPAGVYTVTVNADGASASVPVTVATKTEQIREAQRINRADSKLAQGNCYAKYVLGQMTVDCWDGVRATATFKARLPEGAEVISKKIVGKALCCARGRLVKRITEPRPGVLVATVTVTGWRAFRVKHFQVTYVYLRAY